MMQYNYSYQLNTLNLLKNTLVWLLHSSIILIIKRLTSSCLLHLCSLLLKGLSKLILVIVPLLLSFYSFNSFALSASTEQVINGNPPYITWDNGVTKVTNSDDLLTITLSDGTVITPATNTSSEYAPIELPEKNQSLADISMLVPPNTDSIELSTLIGAPYNYWGDDDGDGQGNSGIKATGKLYVNLYDRRNNPVDVNTVLNSCDAPYHLILTTVGSVLTTKYGIPNKSSFTDSSVYYYINPKEEGMKVCYLNPALEFGDGLQAGPADIWDPKFGFFVQSTDPSSYQKNFPTTGSNNLTFTMQLSSSGKEVKQLTWPSVTKEGVTFKIDKLSSPNLYNVTLNGPVATKEQWQLELPGRFIMPNLPQTFELIGYDSNNNEVIKYGVILKHWFINRGNYSVPIDGHANWCSSIGYRMPLVKELTNAVYHSESSQSPSNGNYYKRNIGVGFFTEWGNMLKYGFQVGFYQNNTSIFTSDLGINRGYVYTVNAQTGKISYTSGSNGFNGLCIYP